MYCMFYSNEDIEDITEPEYITITLGLEHLWDNPNIDFDFDIWWKDNYLEHFLAIVCDDETKENHFYIYPNLLHLDEVIEITLEEDENIDEYLKREYSSYEYFDDFTMKKEYYSEIELEDQLNAALEEECYNRIKKYIEEELHYV